MTRLLLFAGAVVVRVRGMPECMELQSGTNYHEASDVGDGLLIEVGNLFSNLDLDRAFSIFRDQSITVASHAHSIV